MRRHERRHVKGQRGTPFSQCVRAAAKLLKSRHAGDPAATDPQGPSSEPTAGTTPETPTTA